MDLISDPETRDAQPDGSAPAGPHGSSALVHKEAHHARITLVDWMLGNRCNYACSYCPAGLHDGSLGWQRTEHVTGFIDQLARHYREDLGREVWIQFTGGEPTLNPDLPRILAEARARGVRISIISNGSRTLRYWRGLIPSLDSLILTYHPEQVDETHFRAVARLLSASVPVQVNVALPPTRFDEAYGAARRLWEENDTISVILKTLLVEFRNRPYPYSQEQQAAIKRGFPSKQDPGAVTPRAGMRWRAADGSLRDAHTSRMILEGTNRWRGFRCMAGVESLRVTGTGEVHRAVCGVGGALGHISQPILLPLVGITCDREVCSCVSDIHVTKLPVP